MKRAMLIGLTVAVLFAAGAGTAYAVKRLHRVNLRPGHCVKVKRPRERVCARKQHVKTRTRTTVRTVTHTVTGPERTVTSPVTVWSTITDVSTVTVTVSPSPIGETFHGTGSSTLAPLTLPHGVEVWWTAAPDSYGDDIFQVTGDDGDTLVDFDNGDSAASGTSYIPAGTYTLDVTASAAWTLSF